MVAVAMAKARNKRAGLLPHLSARQRDVLDSLAVFGDWARPMVPRDLPLLRFDPTYEACRSTLRVTREGEKVFRHFAP